MNDDAFHQEAKAAVKGSEIPRFVNRKKGKETSKEPPKKESKEDLEKSPPKPKKQKEKKEPKGDKKGKEEICIKCGKKGIICEFIPCRCRRFCMICTGELYQQFKKKCCMHFKKIEMIKIA